MGDGNLRPVRLLGVRRWHEDDLTPIVVDGRDACGSVAEHVRRGCIALEVKAGAYELIHLTTADALRLADLLRAMAHANPEVSDGQ